MGETSASAVAAITASVGDAAMLLLELNYA
jgi:hypothetical protein